MKRVKGETPAEGRRLVLVVDDDLAVRKSLKFALELEGLKVHTFAGAADLLSAPSFLREAECLVLDYLMPAMDGFTLMTELKARKCALPVILIVSNATEAVRRRAASAGVRHVVEKPLLDSALIESIRDVLSAAH